MDMLERFLSGEVSVGCWDVDAVEAFRDALLFGCDSRGIVIRNWAGTEIDEEWFEKFEPGGFANDFEDEGLCFQMILNVETGTRSLDFFYEYSYADDDDLSEELVDAKDFVSCMTNAPAVELVVADADVRDLFD